MNKAWKAHRMRRHNTGYSREEKIMMEANKKENEHPLMQELKELGFLYSPYLGMVVLPLAYTETFSDAAKGIKQLVYIKVAVKDDQVYIGHHSRKENAFNYDNPINTVEEAKEYMIQLSKTYAYLGMDLPF